MDSAKGWPLVQGERFYEEEEKKEERNLQYEKGVFKSNRFL